MSYHSITFQKSDTNKRNTFDDWGLMITSKPIVALPPVNTNYVTVPGASGSLDLTEALSGYPTYGDREGSFEFIMLHTGLNTSLDDPKGYVAGETAAFEKTLRNIAGYLHGQKMKMVLDDDPEWYYEGRFTLETPTAEEQYEKITINYHLDSFKYALTYSKSMWLWNPLKFSAGVNKYTGVIEGEKGTHIPTYDGDNNTFTSNTQIDIQNPMDYPVSCKVYVSVAATVKTPSGNVDLQVGSNENGLLLLYPGNNTWYFSSKDGAEGKYTIEFQKRGI